MIIAHARLNHLSIAITPLCSCKWFLNPNFIIVRVAISQRWPRGHLRHLPRRVPAFIFSRTHHLVIISRKFITQTVGTAGSSAARPVFINPPMTPLVPSLRLRTRKFVTISDFEWSYLQIRHLSLVGLVSYCSPFQCKYLPTQLQQVNAASDVADCFFTLTVFSVNIGIIIIPAFIDRLLHKRLLLESEGLGRSCFLGLVFSVVLLNKGC